MQGVAFAKADAQEIAETLSSQFAVSDDDLHLWINEDATKTRFENDLSYLAATMGHDDKGFHILLCRTWILRERRKSAHCLG